MKPVKILALLGVLAMFALLQSCCSSKVVKVKKSNSYVEVKDILESVQYALKVAYDANEERYRGDENALSFVESVELEFGNSIVTKFGGEVSFWVIKAGGSRNKEKATTFTYGFKPLKNRDEPFSADEEKKRLLNKRSEKLIAALRDLGTCLHKYENPNFLLTNIDLALEITITNSAEAGVEFNIGVVGVNPSGSFESTNSNKMTLALKFPERYSPDELNSNKEAVAECSKLVNGLSNVDKTKINAILDELKGKSTVKKSEWSEAIESSLLKIHNEKLLDDYTLGALNRMLSE